MTLVGLISRALLLVALLGTATVPSGFMRASGPGGMRLVLCTPDGPQEVWLTEAGEVVPVDDRQDHDPPQCIQVSVAGTDMPPRFGALIRLPPWPTAPPLAFDQRATAQANPNHHRARAPPFPA